MKLELIRSWLGISPEYAIKQFGLRNQLSPILLVLAILLAGAFVAYLYWREKNLSGRFRLVFGILRTITYAAILVMLFEPFLEITRDLVVRPNLLVMIDRSESMAIADVRRKPQELADAAIASGKTKFTMPETQEALARAQQAMQESITALKQNRFDEALASQRGANTILASALKDAPADGSLADISRAVQDIAQQQNGLCGTAERYDKEGNLNADRVRELAGSQEKIAQGIDKINDQLRQVQPNLPADVQGAVGAISRMTLAKTLIDHPQTRIFDRIAKAYNVKFFTFGDKLESVTEGLKDLKAIAAIEPKAKSTDGGDAILEAVAQQGGQPVAGVVMLTDGAFNAGSDPLEIARQMKQQGVPLYPLGLGLEAPDDVGLRSLIVPNAIFPKDEVRAKVQVFSHGYVGAKTSVRVLLNGAEVAQLPVDLTDDAQFIDIPFKAPEGLGGSAKLTVTVGEQPGEITTANNSIERTVRIIDQKIKVLYVEGKPRWEYRYLRVVLLRDPRLSVKFLMTQGDKDLAAASPDYIAKYPDTPEEAFSYDLIILGDVPSWYFTTPQLERMVQLVRERGGSLLMLAGDLHTPSSYVDSPLAEILPVRITDGREPVPANAFPVATAQGKQSLAMLESTEAANDVVWSQVHPLYQLPILKGAKPAASVMLELPAGPTRSEAYPLVAWQYVGTGKSMFVGSDQLWRLRFKRGDQYHARFWGQTIQFLALSRLLGENKRIRLETDRAELRSGERLEIHANVLTEFYAPSPATEYPVQIEEVSAETNGVAAATSVKLKPVPGSPGLFEGSCTLTKEGRYSLRARNEDLEFASSVNLVVAASDPEKKEPAMQEDTLRKMAHLSGGRYLSVREWPALPGVIGGKEHKVVEHKTVDLWDVWPPYVLIVLCLGMEWFMRRRRHLV